MLVETAGSVDRFSLLTDGKVSLSRTAERKRT
jgi:hypothetical protein